MADENFSRMRYLSYVFIGFAVYALGTDFFFPEVWNDEMLSYYKILDLIFGAIATFSLIFYHLYKGDNYFVKNLVQKTILFLVLCWAAAVSGFEITTFGFSTFILVMIFSVFFIYTNLITAAAVTLSAVGVFLVTVMLHNVTNENMFQLIAILFPVVAITIFMSHRNYKNKVNDLVIRGQLEELNDRLSDHKKHLEKEVEKRTYQLAEINETLNKQNREYECLNEELLNTNNELLLAKERAEESDRLKTVFLNNMSHEIRTPMNGIMGFAELLNNSDIPAEKRKVYSGIIINSSKQLLKIIDDILEISILETKQLKAKHSVFRLDELLTELFSIFQFEAEKKNIDLKLNNEMSASESLIVSDRSKLHKILSNLLENALKYTDEGFIEFGCRKSGGKIEIYVKDTGIGIEEEKQESVFERFVQGAGIISEERGGLGIGLSIVKENTALIGGELRLDSRKGQGSTFTISIPYITEKKVTTEEKDMGANGQVSKTYTILVAEDEYINYLYLETVLKDAAEIKCSILHAGNGIEAVEMAKNNNDIDLVLMDIKLPELDGLKAAEQIKEFKPELPILAQTAYSTSEDEKAALDAGCNDFISKPIPIDTLIRKVKKMLSLE